MDRYSVIKDKNQREIVLLKALPCVWNRCSFCDYTLDNENSVKEINSLNREVLKNITGEFKVLEVINSGSCFEIPRETLNMIKDIIKEKKIEKMFLESHWCYRSRLDEMRDFFGIPIVFKIGVETFDYDFRNIVLNKNANFKSYEEVNEYFGSVCLMVGIKGQIKSMINKDIKILEENFPYGTINIFTNNTTEIKRDEELIKWFKEKYAYLDENPNIEVLYNNTDFGVGD